MSVPNTTTFTLQDVINEIQPATRDLLSSIADADINRFDPIYYTDPVTDLLEFRNYGVPTIVETNPLGPSVSSYAITATTSFQMAQTFKPDINGGDFEISFRCFLATNATPDFVITAKLYTSIDESPMVLIAISTITLNSTTITGEVGDGKNYFNFIPFDNAGLHSNYVYAIVLSFSNITNGAGLSFVAKNPHVTSGQPYGMRLSNDSGATWTYDAAVNVVSLHLKILATNPLPISTFIFDTILEVFDSDKWVLTGGATIIGNELTLPIAGEATAFITQSNDAAATLEIEAIDNSGTLTIGYGNSSNTGSPNSRIWDASIKPKGLNRIRLKSNSGTLIINKFKIAYT